MADFMIDTHCHLDIIQEQGQEIPISLEKTRKSGVDHLVQIGIDLPSSKRAIQISETYSSPELKIHYSIGCHPTETHEFPNADEILELAKSKLEDPNFSAIGEIGWISTIRRTLRRNKMKILRKFFRIFSR